MENLTSKIADCAERMRREFGEPGLTLAQFNFFVFAFEAQGDQVALEVLLKDFRFADQGAFHVGKEKLK